MIALGEMSVAVVPPSTMPVVLEEDARPLNSHEISKVFCSILSGVATADPDQIQHFPALLRDTREVCTSTSASDLLDLRSKIHRRPSGHEPTWRTAFSSTVAGFYGWCKPLDVELALTWLTENIARMFPSSKPALFS